MGPGGEGKETDGFRDAHRLSNGRDSVESTQCGVRSALEAGPGPWLRLMTWGPYYRGIASWAVFLGRGGEARTVMEFIKAS